MKKAKKLSIASFCVTSFSALFYICFQIFSPRGFGILQVWNIARYGFIYCVGPAAMLVSDVLFVLVCCRKPPVKFIIANAILVLLNVFMVVSLRIIPELAAWA